MKTAGPGSPSQKLVSEVHLARIRVAKAEGQLSTAKEMARVARRRRKEAKQAARRTKKQARLAKREVTDAKLALAEAEAKLSRFNQRANKAKSVKRKVGKTAVAPRPKQAVQLPATTSHKPARKPGKRKASVSRKARITNSPVTVPREPRSPLPVTTSTLKKATNHVVELAAAKPAVHLETTDRPVEPMPSDIQSE